MSNRNSVIPVHRPYLGKEEKEAVCRVLDSRWLGQGNIVREFEENLRDFLGVKHVVAVNTGTSALHIALETLGIQAGDEVIVPSLTYVASVQAILATGAKPVFCEVRAETLTMDMDDAFQRVTQRTKAIMPVHYGGQVCEMDKLITFAHAHKISIVEDAVHAFGSTYKGRKVGTLGTTTCFSFDPIKNITCGNGGAIVTDSDEIADCCIDKRYLGINTKTRCEKNKWLYKVVTSGYRYQMSDINAAIGLEQLKRYDSFKERKCDIARRYDKTFKNINGLIVLEKNLNEIFPFLYVIRVLYRKRDLMVDYLKEQNIETSVHFIPNHLQPFFANSWVILPVTEQLYGEILTLPLFYEMTDNNIEKVISAVKMFCKKYC